MNNILLCSVGRRKYLIEYFKDAWKDKGKVHACNSVETLATQAADHSFISPLIYQENYISSLIDYCNRFSISTIMSLFDIDLLILSKHKKDFLSNGITVLLADENSISICNDKWKTYQFLIDNNIGTPKTYKNILDAKDAILKGNLSYPVIVKPRWGMASIGVYSVENDEELTVLYNKSKQDAFRTHLKYESSLTASEAVIIQEKMSGFEYGIDVLNDLNGRYVATFAKKKITMRAGETDIGEIVSPLPFQNMAEIISNKIKHQGLLSVDSFVSDSNIFVTEINCRISGHYPISHIAGVDLPRQIIKWIEGGGTDKSLLHCKEGTLVSKDLVPTIFHPTK